MLRNGRICSIEYINGLLDHGLLLGLAGQGVGGGADDHGLGSNDSPIWAGATITGCSILGLNSALFQPATNSTTFGQWLNVAGASILNLDSTNRQVTIGQTSATYPFLINSTDATDQIQIYHDDSHAWIKWNDGNLTLITDEGDNTSTYVNIKGKGTGRGFLQVFDQDDAEYLFLSNLGGVGYLASLGTSPSRLSLQFDAAVPIYMFEDATEGETQEFRIYGFGSGSGGKESLNISVEKYAANTADFYGLDSYMFDGILKSTGGAQLGDGGTTNYTEVEADGTIEFHGTATVWNDANVGGMTLTVPVANQPDEVNFLDEAGGDTGITTWGYAVGEKSSGAIEIPHDYKEGSDIYFHIHWQGIAAPSGTDYVKWQLIYTVAAANGEETLDAATTITVETAFDTQYEFKLSSSDPAITGTNFQMGDQFLFALERVAAIGDAYLGDALIATVGLHYECDTVGSRQMLTKA